MNMKPKNYVVVENYFNRRQFYSETCARVHAHNLSKEVRFTPIYVIHIPSGEIKWTYVNGERKI